MAQPIGMKAGLAGVLKVYNLLKLALIFPYSAENGASNRSKSVFRFYSQLKLALSLSLKSTKYLNL
jgi:hypothetical protein